jgi:DNA polymerase-1
MSPEKKKRNKAKPHSLEAVARRELAIELDKEHQNADWGGELSPTMLEYAAKDAQILLPLAEVFEPKVMDSDLKSVWEIERRAFRAMLWMARAGVPLDAEGSSEHLRRNVETEVNRLKEKLDELAQARLQGRERNRNSPKQVKEAFALAGVKLPDTAKETLSRCNHPLAKTLLEYREASKIATTYGPKLLARVRSGGRIYPSWRQIGAGTGRMSCSSPNIQQTPKEGELRRYIRPSEGRMLAAADYSQAKLRILARASGESTLVEAFQAGKDPYKATAEGMFGVPERGHQGAAQEGQGRQPQHHLW